jgi:hypothetical protein
MDLRPKKKKRNIRGMLTTGVLLMLWVVAAPLVGFCVSKRLIDADYIEWQAVAAGLLAGGAVVAGPAFLHSAWVVFWKRG